MKLLKIKHRLYMFGFDSTKLLFVKGTQGNKNLYFIVNTGSGDNVIDIDCLKELEHQNIADKLELHGVGDTVSAESCILDFKLRNRQYSEKFVTAYLGSAFRLLEESLGITISGMLGCEFLEKQQAVINLPKMFLKLY